MKLTVVIPVYNVEKYIEKCLRSVLDNGISADYEIIVVDDESPDNSLRIVKRYAEKYPNIKVISQTNKGLGGARNTGILNASGKYILFLDADDWYLPNTISALLETAESSDVDVLEFGAQGITPDNNITYSKSIPSEGVMNGIEYYRKFRYLDSACNKMYHRKFLVNNGFLFLEKVYIEDYEFNTRVFFKAEKVMATDIIAAQFLQSPESITRTVDSDKHVKMQEDIILVIKKVNTIYLNEVQKGLDAQRIAYFEQRLNYLTATLFYQLIKQNFSFNALAVLRERLIKERIFFVGHTIFDKKKDMFRRVLLRHFWLLRIAKPLFRFIN